MDCDLLWEFYPGTLEEWFVGSEEMEAMALILFSCVLKQADSVSLLCGIWEGKFWFTNNTKGRRKQVYHWPDPHSEFQASKILSGKKKKGPGEMA